MDKVEHIEGLDILETAVGTRTLLDVTVRKESEKTWKANGSAEFFATRDGNNWGSTTFSAMAYENDAENALGVVMMALLGHTESNEFVEALSESVKNSEQETEETIN